MSSNSEMSYYLIFDTNALFQSYEKKADFTAFSFNATYGNVIDMINQLDIYSQVILAIPSVVWTEMEKQIIEKHDELLVLYKSTITKKLFPEYSIVENAGIDYPQYIKKQIESYKAEIKGSINKVIELPIASKGRYQSIVNRAFNKMPPFEGREKKSDKGFKDALLWESILEFASNHLNARIIYYSRDNAFGEFLLKEFEASIPNSTLSICKNENDVKEQLESWAKEIDKYSFQPIEEYFENKEIIEWLTSGDFEIQVIDRDFGIVEKGRLISTTIVKLNSIDNIECTMQNDDFKEYYIDIVLGVEYQFKDGGKTSETVDATVRVETFDDIVYSIEDVYRTNGTKNESEAKS